MNKSLQELINIYVYELNSRPICQIHFKGRVEAYDICSLDELLGDILEICRIRDDIYFDEVLNTNLDDRYRIINGSRYLEVAVVMVDSNIEDIEVENTLDDIVFDECSIYDEVNKLLEELELNHESFSTDIIGRFIGAKGYYAPRHTIRKLKEVCTEPLGEEAMWLFEEDPIGLLERDQKHQYVYNYECDNMEEVFMAFIHYLSVHKYYLSKCKICGRYFIPLRRKDEKYCPIMRSGDFLNCKDIGRKRTRVARLQNDLITKKYNSAYTNISNKMNAKKYSDLSSQQRLWEKREKLVKEFRTKKKELTEDELLLWLDEFRFVQK